MVTLEDIKQAQKRIRGVAVRTPLVAYYPPPVKGTSGKVSRQLYFKPESFQPIGSFKLRGAYNKVASLSAEER